MAIAHICLDCGWDLARVRPRMEPRYGLNIITCPRCGGTSVRRVHPLLTGWKALRRADWALTALAVQAILLVAATIASVLSIVALIAAASLIVSNNAEGDIGWFFFVPLAIAAPFVGFWLTAGFGHLRRRWIVWMAWSAWLTFIMAVIVVAPFLVTGRFNLDPLELGVEASTRLAVVAAAFVLAIWITALSTFMIAALAGIPLGLAFLWLAARARTQQWRWRRRTRRNALVAS